jgi:hypothetical protein
MTSAIYTSKIQDVTSPNVATSRPFQVRFREAMVLEGKVYKPEKPVSITASTSSVWVLFFTTTGSIASQF